MNLVPPLHLKLALLWPSSCDLTTSEGDLVPFEADLKLYCYFMYDVTSRRLRVTFSFTVNFWPRWFDLKVTSTFTIITLCDIFHALLFKTVQPLGCLYYFLACDLELDLNPCYAYRSNLLLPRCTIILADHMMSCMTSVSSMLYTVQPDVTLWLS